jgi:hypothetical protein
MSTNQQYKKKPWVTPHLHRYEGAEAEEIKQLILTVASDLVGGLKKAGNAR